LYVTINCVHFAAFNLRTMGIEGRRTADGAELSNWWDFSENSRIWGGTTDYI